jgi:hypothetical protein
VIIYVFSGVTTGITVTTTSNLTESSPPESGWWLNCFFHLIHIFCFLFSAKSKLGLILGLSLGLGIPLIVGTIFGIFHYRKKLRLGSRAIQSTVFWYSSEIQWWWNNFWIYRFILLSVFFFYLSIIICKKSNIQDPLINMIIAKIFIFEDVDVRNEEIIILHRVTCTLYVYTFLFNELRIFPLKHFSCWAIERKEKTS